VSWHVTGGDEAGMSYGTVLDELHLDFQICVEYDVLAEGHLSESCLRADHGSDDSACGLLLWARSIWPTCQLWVRSEDLKRVGHSFRADTWTHMPLVIPSNRMFGTSAIT
jgi:hypothetical protein